MLCDCGIRASCCDSRHSEGITRRRYKCANGHKFTTVEHKIELSGGKASLRNAEVIPCAKFWSEADDAFLKTYYASMNISLLAQTLNRTATAIYVRANMLGISKKQQSVSVQPTTSEPNEQEAL